MVADFDMAIALEAARPSVELRLPMADGVMLAAAWAHNVTLWTQISTMLKVSSMFRSGAERKDGQITARARGIVV